VAKPQLDPNGATSVEASPTVVVDEAALPSRLVERGAPPGPEPAVVAKRSFALPRITAVGVAVAGVLLMTAALRIHGIAWDSGHHLHPDERFITTVASSIRFPPPDQYFDSARSPLNPNGQENVSYVYGTLPLFITRLAGQILQPVVAAVIPSEGVSGALQGLRETAGYGGVYLIGRALSALADVLTILLVFLIGRRLYDSTVGLVSAVLGAFTVLMIQTAHFFTVESMLTLFCTLAVYYALRSTQSGRLRDWAVFGVATGLAAACKPTALMLIIVAGVAAALFAYRVLGLSERPDRRRLVAEDLVTGLFAFAGLAVLVFRIAQPYAFSGPGIFNLSFNQRYLDVLANFQRIGVGEVDIPFNHSWAGAIPFVWQLTQMGLWGMGPALALACWLGVGLALLRMARNPSRYHLELITLSWVLVNFAYWGVQFTKLMRYLLPIYPELLLFGGLFVVSLWRWGSERIRSGQVTPRAYLAGWAMRGGAAVVVGCAAVYALAFSSIYTAEVTRVQASHWIHDNIPEGSRLGVEHWDDSLPLSLPNRTKRYQHLEYPLYNEDSPDKRELLLARLEATDYLILSSNRLYGSIPKLPQRYPMTSRYYEALFAGELGFEKAVELTSRPRLFGIELNDDDAEESFTVYDHPKVTIFKKAASYDAGSARRILESVSLDHALRNLKPIQAGSSGLLQSENAAAAQRSGGTWAEMFDRGSLINHLPLPVWYLTVQLIGLAALPFTWFVCRRLGDGGYPLAKTIGWLVIAYVPWLLASVRLVPYSRLSILLSVGLLAAMSAAVLARHRATFVQYLVLRWRLLLAVEALFGVAFLAFAALRAVNPDLWHSAYGGEKPMDFAYLNAVIKSTWFPAYDPWFAGGYLNYYYFGQVMVASLVKLTGIVPWVAYNLAIPTVAALVTISVASAVFNLLISRPGGFGRRVWAFGAGVFAAVLAVVGGNLHGVVQIFEWVVKLDRAQGLGAPVIGGIVGFARGLFVLLTSLGKDLPPFNFDFWGPTRVITTEATAPITEFPYFTFLYGDLHAHMLAMPVGLLAVGLAINLLRQPSLLPDVDVRRTQDALRALARAAVSPAGLTIGLGALAVAILRMTNSWDYPTYLGLLIATVLLVEAMRPNRVWSVAMARFAVLSAALVVGSHALALPFLRNYELFYAGFQLTKDHTILPHYLIVMGSFLAFLGTYLLFQLSALRTRLALGALGVLGTLGGATTAQSAVATGSAADRMVAPSIEAVERNAMGVLLGAGFLALLFWLAGIPVVAVAGLGIAAILSVAWLRPLAPATWFTFLLAATALAITAGVEILVLKGDIGRMNTVFKFYLPAWFFLSVASGVVLALLARRARGSRWLLRGGRRLVPVFLALVLAAVLVYPVLGTPAKVRHRFVTLPPTLDGMIFMSQADYRDEKGDMHLPDDFAGINWLLDNVQGSPVIAEGLSPLYHWRSRVSNYTGLPSIIGWDWHQKQQRGEFGYMVDDRVRDVATLFGGTDVAAARAVLTKYGVEYVYVGGQERGYYPGAGLQKLDAMGDVLERVFQSGVVTIYRVRR
jgi:YYY domain-containing protein